MSTLIGAASPNAILSIKDTRIQMNYQIIRRMRDRIAGRNESTTQRPGGYSSDYWPGRLGFHGDGGTDVGIMDAQWSRQIARVAQGSASRVGFPGVTRDQYGAPLAGCTVILHKTADDLPVYKGVSGADGAFLAQSVYAGENHYIVFHKTGPINVFGATDNTLVGA